MISINGCYFAWISLVCKQHPAPCMDTQFHTSIPSSHVVYFTFLFAGMTISYGVSSTLQIYGQFTSVVLFYNIFISSRPKSLTVLVEGIWSSSRRRGRTAMSWQWNTPGLISTGTGGWTIREPTRLEFHLEAESWKIIIYLQGGQREVVRVFFVWL